MELVEKDVWDTDRDGIRIQSVVIVWKEEEGRIWLALQTNE